MKNLIRKGKEQIADIKCFKKLILKQELAWKIKKVNLLCLHHNKKGYVTTYMNLCSSAVLYGKIKICYKIKTSFSFIIVFHGTLFDLLIAQCLQLSQLLNQGHRKLIRCNVSVA